MKAEVKAKISCEVCRFFVNVFAFTATFDRCELILIGLSKKRPLYSKAWCLVCVLKNVWKLAKWGGGGVFRTWRNEGISDLAKLGGGVFRTWRNEGISDLVKWGYFGLGKMGGVFRTWRNEGISDLVNLRVFQTSQSAGRNTPPPPFRTSDWSEIPSVRCHARKTFIPRG